MKKEILIVGTICLFIGVGIQPAFAVEPVKTSKINNVENTNPKEYLFQTIVDIANNPDVNELLKRVDNGCCNPIRFNFNNVDIYKKSLFNIPKLLLSMFFIKPSLTYNYLNSAYNRGCKLTNIIGDEKVNEIVKSVEVTNPEFFNELNYIIMNNDELSNRISILKEMNKELMTDSSSEDYPIICLILGVYLAAIMIIFYPIHTFFMELFEKYCEEEPNFILCYIAFFGVSFANLFIMPPLYLHSAVFHCYTPPPP